MTCGSSSHLVTWIEPVTPRYATVNGLVYEEWMNSLSQREGKADSIVIRRQETHQDA